MTKKRFVAHGSNPAPASAGIRLSEPVLVLANAVALVDGVSVEQLIASLIRERGRALGLDALADAAPENGGHA